MGAIGIHHTEVDDAAFDGPANEARLKLDQSASYYRRAFAWADPEGNPETKPGYKFIHHFVDSEGDIGAASSRGCSSGIGVLNGGRGGTTIPESDREGVWRHLAAHLRDADMEPPELKSLRKVELHTAVDQRGHEVRAFETRMNLEDGKLRGYAAVFEVWSELLGGFFFQFRETIRRGAFSDSLARGDDVRALWQHDPNWVLGRTKNETLALLEDTHGLHSIIDPPDTQWARDAVFSIRRGDVDQMSFAFSVDAEEDEEWEFETEDGIARRTVKRAHLYDVSPVTYPAFIQTSISVRSIWVPDNRHLEMPPTMPPIGMPPTEANSVSDGELARLANLRRRLDLADAQFRTRR